tara:strand:+ start:80 stop:319 length:240 start_codon:yes stop_codon:yes gene_type:complete
MFYRCVDAGRSRLHQSGKLVLRPQRLLMRRAEPALVAAQRVLEQLLRLLLSLVLIMVETMAVVLSTTQRQIAPPLRCRV